MAKIWQLMKAVFEGRKMLTRDRKLLTRDRKLLPGLREGKGSNRLGLFLLRPWGSLLPWLVHICFHPLLPV